MDWGVSVTGTVLTRSVPLNNCTVTALGIVPLPEKDGRRPDVLEVRDVRRILEPLVPKGARRLNTDPLAPYVEALAAVRDLFAAGTIPLSVPEPGTGGLLAIGGLLGAMCLQRRRS